MKKTESFLSFFTLIPFMIVFALLLIPFFLIPKSEKKVKAKVNLNVQKPLEKKLEEKRKKLEEEKKKQDKKFIEKQKQLLKKQEELNKNLKKIMDTTKKLQLDKKMLEKKDMEMKKKQEEIKLKEDSLLKKLKMIEQARKDQAKSNESLKNDLKDKMKEIDKKTKELDKKGIKIDNLEDQWKKKHEDLTKKELEIKKKLDEAAKLVARAKSETKKVEKVKTKANVEKFKKSFNKRSFQSELDRLKEKVTVDKLSKMMKSWGFVYINEKIMKEHITYFGIQDVYINRDRKTYGIIRDYSNGFYKTGSYKNSINEFLGSLGGVSALNRSNSTYSIYRTHASEIASQMGGKDQDYEVFGVIKDNLLYEIVLHQIYATNFAKFKLQDISHFKLVPFKDNSGKWRFKVWTITIKGEEHIVDTYKF